MDTKGTTEAERFNSHIYHTTHGCWLWTGALDSRGGYGRFRTTTGGLVAAHRYAWQLHHGPPQQPVIRHTCDIRCCVNPHHLQQGTQADNIEDTIRRGHWRRTALTTPQTWPTLAYTLRTAARNHQPQLIAQLLNKPHQLQLFEPPNPTPNKCSCPSRQT